MRKPKWDTEAGRKMWLEGKTDTQIAAALGTTDRAVNLYKYRKWIPEQSIQAPQGNDKASGKLPPLKSSGGKKKVPKENLLAEIEELERAHGEKLGGSTEVARSPEETSPVYVNTDAPDSHTIKQEETKMNNCIIMGGKRIELTEEQVAKIVAALGAEKVSLSDIPEGDTFKIGEYEFVVLEQREETTTVILKDSLPEHTTFGSNSNYDGSNPDKACCEFAEELMSIIGSENVIPHTVDLTSNDGLKDYGQVERAVSLLTADQYRRYVQILDKEKLDDWWWLATPWSTPSHESDSCVLCVSPSGICCNSCNDYVSDFGVRPFCILKSNIFVSK